MTANTRAAIRAPTPPLQSTSAANDADAASATDAETAEKKAAVEAEAQASAVAAAEAAARRILMVERRHDLSPQASLRSLRPGPGPGQSRGQGFRDSDDDDVAGNPAGGTAAAATAAASAALAPAAAAAAAAAAAEAEANSVTTNTPASPPTMSPEQREELAGAMRRLRTQLAQPEIVSVDREALMCVFESIDLNGDGCISYQVLCLWLWLCGRPESLLLLLY